MIYLRFLRDLICVTNAANVKLTLYRGPDHKLTAMREAQFVTLFLKGFTYRNRIIIVRLRSKKVAKDATSDPHVPWAVRSEPVAFEELLEHSEK